MPDQIQTLANGFTAKGMVRSGPRIKAVAQHIREKVTELANRTFAQASNTTQVKHAAVEIERLIESWNELLRLDAAKFVSADSTGIQRSIDEMCVGLLEDFERWQMLAALKFSHLVERWGILPTLVWIATRDMALADEAEKSGTNFNREDIGLSLQLATSKVDGTRLYWPCSNLDEAWDQLANAMTKGEISCIADRVKKNNIGGAWNTWLGVTFPPEDQPGAALSHFVGDDNGRPELVPNDYTLASEWTTWRNPVFERDRVLSLWPANVVGLNEGAIDNASDVEDIHSAWPVASMQLDFSKLRDSEWIQLDEAMHFMAYGRTLTNEQFGEENAEQREKLERECNDPAEAERQYKAWRRERDKPIIRVMKFLEAEFDADRVKLRGSLNGQLSPAEINGALLSQSHKPKFLGNCVYSSAPNPNSPTGYKWESVQVHRESLVTWLERFRAKPPNVIPSQYMTIGEVLAYIDNPEAPDRSILDSNSLENILYRENNSEKRVRLGQALERLCNTPGLIATRLANGSRLTILQHDWQDLDLPSEEIVDSLKHKPTGKNWSGISIARVDCESLFGVVSTTAQMLENVGGKTAGQFGLLANAGTLLAIDDRASEQPNPVKVTASDAGKRRRYPKLKMAIEAIQEIWPKGIPQTASAKSRDSQIIAWCKKMVIFLPHLIEQ